MIKKIIGKIIQWRWMVTPATLGAVVLATAGQPPPLSTVTDVQLP